MKNADPMPPSRPTELEVVGGLPCWLSGTESTCQSRIRSLIREDPTTCVATKPVCHNY